MDRAHIGMMLSIIGMVFNIVAFHARKKHTLLLLHTAGTCFHMVSYVFSGGDMGIWLNLVFLARCVLFLRAENAGERIRKLLYASICTACALVYVMYTWIARPPLDVCLWNVIPVIGAFFGTYSCVQTDMIKLRQVKMADSVSWLLFNGHVGIGALGGFLGEVLNMVSMLLAIHREKTERMQAKTA